MKIKTNHRFRDLLSYWDLTPKELKQFDYVKNIEENGIARFFRYRGTCYDAGGFTLVPRGGELEAGGWQGYFSETYFSGVLIRYLGGYEAVKVGSYFS